MILKNVAVPQCVAGSDLGGTAAGDCLHGDLLFDHDKVIRLVPGDPASTQRLVLPRLTEAHCHLDKCHTIDRLGPVAGDLSQAIAAQKEDRANWSVGDLTRRMTQGLTEAADAGCAALRSHIDWGEDSAPPVAWHVLGDLARDSTMTVQRSALMGVDKYADPAFCANVAAHVAGSRGGVLGAFLLHHKDREEGLQNIFVQAMHHGLPLDFHVDETLDDVVNLELIADTALRLGFEGPILCGHACSLMNLDASRMDRLTDKLVQARISVCALPTTNLYLQDRHRGTPDRRGITRLQELRAAGVPILVASDNVADAFCPVGQHNPMAALHLAVLCAHLDPPFGSWLPAIMQDARHAMGLPALQVATAGVADLLVCDAHSISGLISGRTGPPRPIDGTLSEPNC